MLITGLKNKRIKLSELFLTLAPLLSFLLFIGANKISYGWYLYPEHTGMMAFDLIPFWGKLKAIFLNIFSDQKRWPLAVGAACIALYLAVKKPKIYRHDFFIFLVIPILGYAIFSALNFYTVRYVLTIFPLAIVLISWLITEALKEKQVWLGVLTTAFLMHSIIQLFDRRSVRDIDLSYLDYGPAQLEVVKYMEQNELYDESIQTTFLLGTGLTQKYGGYRNTDQVFTKVNREIDDKKKLLYLFKT